MSNILFATAFAIVIGSWGDYYYTTNGWLQIISTTVFVPYMDNLLFSLREEIKARHIDFYVMLFWYIRPYHYLD